MYILWKNLVLITIMGSMIVFNTYGYRKKVRYDRNNYIINKLKKIMANNKTMTEEYKNLAELYTIYLEHISQGLTYVGNTYEQLFYVNGKPNFSEIPHLGVVLLQSYAYKKNKDYLAIVEDIISKTDTILGIIKTWDTPPLGMNWYYWSVPYTQMMAMYEYLGNNTRLKMICHKRIRQIIPQLNKSLGSERTGVNLVYIAIPRLLTNYLYDPVTYKSEVKSYSFKKLGQALNLDFNPKDEDIVKDNVYSDYSCIFHTYTANYAYALSSGDFYVDVFKALGYRANAADIITEKILPKILHPDLPYVTFGLFGRTGQLIYDPTNFVRYNKKKSSDYGLHIMPFIGLGIFKSEKFMFSLRVQRKYIAAYESDIDNGEFGLGWVQLRKLYLTDVYNQNKNIYGVTTDWDKLVNQPGIISADNNPIYDLRTNITGQVAFYFTDNVYSHIGRLVDNKVLFWINRYRLHKHKEGKLGPYNAGILELGVCTENGLLMRYHISNFEKKRLKMKVVDKDNKHKMHFVLNTNNVKGGFVVVPPKSLKVLEWRMVFDKDEEPKGIYWDDANVTMTFRYDDNEYTVKGIDKEYFAVSFMNGRVTIIGSSKSNINDTFHYHGRHYKRDPESLMYLSTLMS